jgi:protein-L-isoaspartate(D-aspartate) O-methyltransferase
MFSAIGLAKSNADMVMNLQNWGFIKSKAVAMAMNSIDRKHYAPQNCYQDMPQYIGCNATISAPHMHAAAMEVDIILIN